MLGLHVVEVTLSITVATYVTQPFKEGFILAPGLKKERSGHDGRDGGRSMSQSTATAKSSSPERRASAQPAG